MKNINIIKSIFAAVAMAAAGAQADTWKDPSTGYTWRYRFNGGTVEIFGVHNSRYSSAYYAPCISPSPNGAVTIPSSLGGKTVTSVGAYAFQDCSGLTSVTIPNSVTSIGSYAFYNCSGLTSVTIPNSVTSIGGCAFLGCCGLTSVTIPNSVTSVGASAFYGCSGLMSVTIPNSVTSIGSYAFYNCSGLTSVTIGKAVTSIGGYAFYGCSGLTSVTIPNSVTSIGGWAFEGCSGLTSVTIPDSVTSIGYHAFYGTPFYDEQPDGLIVFGKVACEIRGMDPETIETIIIPDGVVGIGAGAFSGFSRLQSVTIPSSVTCIGDSAFYDCGRLKSVTIPNSVTSIGAYAFYNCGLTSVTIPNGVVSIGGSVFEDCKRLASVTLPDSVTSIDDYAFYGCVNLEGVTIPAGVTSIGSTAFYDTPFLDEQPDGLIVFGKVAYAIHGADRETIETIIIPDGVVSIADSAFCGCSGLTSVMIPDSVTSIGYDAFWGCSALTSVTIPNSVTSIGGRAFEDCRGLASVTIPNSVTSIGGEAFSGCIGLTSMTLPFVGARRGDSESWDSLFGCIFKNGYYDYGGADYGTRVTQCYSSDSVSDVRFYIPSSLKSVTITDETILGYGAFSGCSGLTSVTISNGVTSIGSRVFEGCSGLTSVTIPDSVTSISESAFKGCSGLTSVTIPDSVTSIGNSAFSGCSGLTSVTIPDSVMSIGSSAFSGCSGLTSVTIPDSVTSIGSYVFNDCRCLASVTIPGVVTNIGERAFYNCSGLMSVTIPYSVKSIGSDAFSGCSGLTSVTIPESVTSIGDCAFNNCRGVRDVTVPQYVLDCQFKNLFSSACSSFTNVFYSSVITNIGAYAFYGCSGLANVTIPDSVTSIGSYAFCNCSGLTSVTIPDSVTSIGEYAFRGCSGLRDVVLSQYVCTNRMADVFSPVYQSIKNVVISDSVTSIGASAFYNCRSLESVTIPDSVTSIGRYAFSECYHLASITIPGSVTSIGSSAFSGCYGLTSVTIPQCVCTSELSTVFPGSYQSITNVVILDGVTSIGEGAFCGCSGLAGVTLPDGLTHIEASAFASCSNLTEVVIPESVWSIGAEAFANCAAMKRVMATRGLKSAIEAKGVFAGCSADLKIDYVSAEIADVKAKQRHPWNGKVDISYTVTGDVRAGLSPQVEVALAITAIDRANNTNYVAAASALSGDTGTEAGAHHVVWDLNAQGVEFRSDDVVFSVAYTEKKYYRYCVIDLSGDADAASYPLAYMAAPPEGGFNADEYKTDKLVLRLIEPGSFMMGGSYHVTLTKPFYCGIFEVTQKQYELVTGTNPSQYKGDMRPVEELSWGTIRGSSSDWPSSANVDQNSFMGRLQTRTGLNFDLPTEAQWEYACRAETTSTYNNGGNTEDDLRQVGRYTGNRSDGRGGYSEHTTVGSYLPNAWGLYDMHGNVWEWCLDRYGNLSDGVTDPVGASSGSKRVRCGCAWGNRADECASLQRVGNYDASQTDNGCGFRLVRTLSNAECERDHEAVAETVQADVLCVGDSVSVAIDSRVNADPVLDPVVLPWDSSWIGGDANATVVIADNGMEVKRTIGRGEFSLSDVGRHELTYTTYIDGVAQDEVYTATVYVKWKYDVVDGGAVITETSQTAGLVTIPSEIDGYPVICVGSRAFIGCSGLTSVTIPTSVTNIGENAFAGCGNLTSVTIVECMTGRSMSDWFPNSYGKIRHIDFVGNITSLPDCFFEGCDSLESVSVAESVSGFGDNDMRWAVDRNAPEGLFIKDGWVFGWVGDEPSGIAIPEGVRGFAPYALCGFYDRLENVTMPLTLKFIGAKAFAGDSYLDDVVIPDWVETIGDGAFEDCSYIQTLKIGAGVKTVGRRAFAGCTQLANAVFADGLLDVGEETFSNCWRMASVSLPLSTTNVGSMAFIGCTSLTGVTTPTSHGTMAEWFAGVYTNIQSVTVPEGETTIVSNMFAGCTSLAAIQLPDGITDIGESAFRDCVSLTEMALPGSVRHLGVGALEGCSQIATLTLPNGLAELPDNVFAGCDAIDSFVVPASVTNLGSRFCASGTTAIYYLGNAPAYAADAYDDAPDALTSYVVRGTKGWDGRPTSRDIPQTWIGHAITTWEATRFDVTFDANGGKFMPEDADTYACEEVTDTGYSLPPNVPVLAGYKFAGYWTEPDAGSRVTSATRVSLTKAHTLYAHWRVGAKVTVRFNARGGTVQPGEGVYTSEAPYGELPVPTREHYKFAGWWTQAEGGTQVTVASETPKANHELFAHWTPAPCVIRFHANNGTSETRDQEFTYGESVTLTANTFAMDGYAFAGWATTEGGTAVYPDKMTLVDVPGMQNDVLHLYASWVSTRYAVRFDSNGGVGRMDSQTLVRDVEVNLVICAFTRTGYEFAGWGVSATGPVVYGDGASVTNVYEQTGSDVALYAVWVPIEYSIQYDPNGGTGEMADQSMVYDVAAPLASSQFVLQGSMFRGWATAAGGNVVYEEGTSVVNLSAVADDVVTLYAVWQEKPAAVVTCEAAFSGSGVVTLDDYGNAVVTLTNDISGTVEIPDNVGSVTIDLNGHNITGSDGGAGIRIVAGEDEGVVTTLAIGDTSEGEKGQIIGDGESSGIEVSEDVTSVNFDVDDTVVVLNGDGTEQEFKPKLVGTGTVTVPKTWKTGQKVTWKAKADKGSVFARWEGPLVDSLNLTRNERRNPSLAFAVPEGFETNMVTAVFIPIDADGLSEFALTQTEFELKAAVDGVWVIDDSESYVTASVSGLPTGLKFDAKTLRITGAPTKSGVFWVQVKGKNASGFQSAENIKVTVSGGGSEANEPKLTRMPYHPLTVICATEGGTATGTGVYAEGKKAAIKATAAKGYVFAGWYEDSRLTTPATFEKGDFRTASQNVVVPEMRYVFARFVTAEDDKKNVSLAVDGVGMRCVEDAAPYQTNIMCGVYMEWPVEVEALSLPTVKVSGLPAGLKFTDKPVTAKVGTGKTAVVVTNVPANTIYGAPTAASKVDTKTGIVKPSVVKVTVTTAGKTKVVYEIDVTVDAIKAWAVGTFDGAAFSTGETPVVSVNGQDARSPSGLASLTVSAAGKISGKLLEGGKTWTLSATNFDAYDAEAGIYTATVLGKSGKAAITNEVTVSAETAPCQRGVVTGDGWTAWQNLWKAEPWKTEAKAFAKAKPLIVEVGGGRGATALPGVLSVPDVPDVTSGTITLKFATSGAVTASGKFVTGQDAKGRDVVYSASCSSVLVPAAGARDARPYHVFLYFPPKAGKFEGYSAEISLVWDGAAFVVE